MGAVQKTRDLWVARGANRTPLQVENAIPYQTPPGLDVQTEEGRRTCDEYRTRVLEGLAKSVPRVVNVGKAFGAPQKKEETPDEYLERLKKGMRQYTGLDPDCPENVATLKLQFISGAYPDIKKKLQKVDDLFEQTLEQLVKEAQKVMVRRDVEKRKVGLMVQVVKEVNAAERGRGEFRGRS